MNLPYSVLYSSKFQKLLISGFYFFFGSFLELLVRNPVNLLNTV